MFNVVPLTMRATFAPATVLIWIHEPTVAAAEEESRSVVVPVPSIKTSAVPCCGVVEPTTRNRLIVVVARLEVAATENTVPTAARPPILRLVVVAFVTVRLVAWSQPVEVALVL